MIWGSTALHYLLRSPHTWQPSDVDLIMPHHRYEEVVEFICHIPDAKVLNEYPQNYAMSGFSHITQVQAPLVKFNIIQSSEPSPFHPLTFYYGTHDMNAITTDLVISAYPSLTFEGHGIIIPPHTRYGTSTPPVIEKNCDRAFGDTFCLILPNTHRPIHETLELMDEHESTLEVGQLAMFKA